MNLTMLLIVTVIIIPGYFIVKRISRIVYSDDSKLEENIENQYGFNRKEKQREENRKKEEDEFGNENNTKTEEAKENITAEGIKKEA